jgi:hypothetical protein
MWILILTIITSKGLISTVPIELKDKDTCISEGKWHKKEFEKYSDVTITFKCKRVK